MEVPYQKERLRAFAAPSIQQLGGSDVEVHDTSSIMCEDDKNEEDFEPNSADGEEVDGRELRNVIIEERTPRSAMVVWGFGPCTWQSKPARS